jgi:hypothetical protein
MANVKSISKVLSPNDVGITGAHQAGMLIPKRQEILSFFPKLGNNQKNPRFLLVFFDDSNQRWEFSFIYYNNSFFGGTRNEYRLTRMTKFIKSNNLKIGDEVILSNDTDGCKKVSYRRSLQQTTGKLKLSGEWKIIEF